jgi:hypothetical protein
MLDDFGPDHVQVYIQKTTSQMFISLHSCGGISLFPESSLSVSAFVVNLANPPSHKLHQTGYGFHVIRG